ncbi:MAG: response regulator [Burkholderiales bacterium]|nr:response regulator [Anaerolineae bacterium]
MVAARVLNPQPLALVIEDNDDIADIIGEVLKSAGFEVEVLQDGRLALLRILDLLPDLIVLDLHLPLADGVEILHDIRADKRMAHIPVIVATADTHKVDMLGPREQPNHVIIKPFGFRHLCDVAKRYYADAVSAPV